MLLNSGSLDNTSTDSNMDYPVGSTTESELTPIIESNGDDMMRLEEPDESNANSSGGTTFGLRYTKTIRGSSGSSKNQDRNRNQKYQLLNSSNQGRKVAQFQTLIAIVIVMLTIESCNYIRVIV